ncbi:MAG: NAD(+)/NADH kinase [Dehalococcoidia bacterium]|nr:NAD(+)/NADH kinase [Dehalococcoidia bacterium]
MGIKVVGVIYHPKIPASKPLAERLAEVLAGMKANAWLCSSWDEEEMSAHCQGSDLAISVGGDGTILRVARLVAAYGIPIVGVNMGHLGFMTEFSAGEVMERLPEVLAGEAWVDQRAMLQVDLLSELKGGDRRESTFHALNDALVGRGSVPRIINVVTMVNGASLSNYRVDGVIVSTATGSTGYSLAAGGPILYPQAEEMLIKPVSAHLSLPYALVLPPTAEVKMVVHTNHEAVLSIDGQVNVPLRDSDTVRAKRSPHIARFLRISPRELFYAVLEQRLKVRE